VIDLGEVVVFSREPEDGGVRAAGLGGAAGAAERGGGFEGDEEGSAEEADLLAGEHGPGTGAECADGGCRVGVLRGEDVDECGPVRGELGAQLPTGIERLEAVEGPQCCAVRTEVGKEPGEARGYGCGLAVCEGQRVPSVMSVSTARRLAGMRLH